MSLSEPTYAPHVLVCVRVRGAFQKKNKKTLGYMYSPTRHTPASPIFHKAKAVEFFSHCTVKHLAGKGASQASPCPCLIFSSNETVRLWQGSPGGMTYKVGEHPSRIPRDADSGIRAKGNAKFMPGYSGHMPNTRDIVSSSFEIPTTLAPGLSIPHQRTLSAVAVAGRTV